MKIYFQRFVEGAPNLIEVPIVPYNALVNGFSFIEQQFIHSVWLWCYDSNYPSGIDVNAMAAYLLPNFSLSTIEETLPPNIFLHERHRFESEESVFQFSRIVSERTKYRERRRQKMLEEVYFNLRGGTYVTQTKSILKDMEDKKKEEEYNKYADLFDKFSDIVTERARKLRSLIKDPEDNIPPLYRFEEKAREILPDFKTSFVYEYDHEIPEKIRKGLSPPVQKGKKTKKKGRHDFSNVRRPAFSRFQGLSKKGIYFDQLKEHLTEMASLARLKPEEIKKLKEKAEKAKEEERAQKEATEKAKKKTSGTQIQIGKTTGNLLNLINGENIGKKEKKSKSWKLKKYKMFMNNKKEKAKKNRKEKHRDAMENAKNQNNKESKPTKGTKEDKSKEVKKNTKDVKEKKPENKK